MAETMSHVVGGSYVGLEFAQIYRRFGSAVTVVEMQPRLIAREDEDVSGDVAKILRPPSEHRRSRTGQGRPDGRRARLHRGRRSVARQRSGHSGRLATATAKGPSHIRPTTISKSSQLIFSTTIGAPLLTAFPPMRSISIPRWAGRV